MLLNETSTPVFPCELCELFKNTYVVENLLTTGSETPVWRSLFNKVAILIGRRPSTVLERGSSLSISLWTLWNFYESIFAAHLVAATFYMMLFFFRLSVRFAVSNQIIWWSNGKLGKGIHKLIQSCVVMEIRSKLLPNCVHTCTNLSISIAGEMEEKEELKNLLKLSKFCFYVTVDREMFPCLKNKK